MKQGNHSTILLMLGKLVIPRGFWLWLAGLCCIHALGAQMRHENYMSYIQKHSHEALRQMDRHAIPASITLAQGLIETGAGRSTLAKDHNNHFGIKCHRDWQGATTRRTDDAPNECFRSYRSWQESYEDHSLFLKRPRYTRLFSLRFDDYMGWARGLQEAGYATNKGYANMLIKVIETYELYTFDHNERPSWWPEEGKRSEGKSKRSTPAKASQERQAPRPAMRPIYKSYGLLYVIANEGDTFDKIAYELDMSPRKLARYNEVPIEFTLQEGDIIYLERKNRSASREYREHTVRIGDSMHSIAQRYGMRIDRLYQLNDLDDEYTPIEGNILKVR